MLKQVKNTSVAFGKAVGDVVVETAKHPDLPVFIGTWYACKKYTTLGGWATFFTSYFAGKTAQFIADKTCEYLEIQEQQREAEKRQNTEEVIDFLKTSRQAENEAAIDAALKKE